MKNFLLPIAVVLLVLSSCTSDSNEIFDNLSATAELSEVTPLANETLEDSVSVFNGDSVLMERMELQRMMLNKSRSITDATDLDPIFVENLSAIQGIPFNLMVKNVAAGCNPTHNAMVTNKNNREPVLTELKDVMIGSFI